MTCKLQLALSMKFITVVIVVLSQLAAQDVAKGMRQMETLSGVYRAEGNTSGAAQNGDVDPFSYLTFFPDGIVRRAHPEEGLQGWDDGFRMNLDRRSGVPSRIALWGAYLLANGQREIIFGDRQVWTIGIAEYPNRLAVQGRTYVLLDSGTGLKLQGTYKSVKDDSFITFTADGRMNEQGIVANCIGSGQHFSYNNGMPSAHSGGSLCLDRPVAGGYSVGNYTLLLSFSNSSQKFAFWADPNSAAGAIRINPQTLYINNVRYELMH
jgi:hypothetical protein